MPFPSPGDLPHPGIEPRSPALQADSSPPEPPGVLPSEVEIGSNLSPVPLCSETLASRLTSLSFSFLHCEMEFVVLTSQDGEDEIGVQMLAALVVQQLFGKWPHFSPLMPTEHPNG